MLDMLLVIGFGNLRLVMVAARNCLGIRHDMLYMSQLRPGHPHFWQGLMKAKDTFFMFCKKKVGDGKMTRFWRISVMVMALS
jgi:hypothetical protein